MNRDAVNDQAWQEFQEELAECLSEMGKDDALIISDRYSGVYVQFCPDGPGCSMYAEAVSNAYLATDEALSDEDYLAMDELGWNLPVSRRDGGSKNFDFYDDDPGDYSRLARLAVRALREVYGINRLSRLQHDCHEIDGTPISFPTLGIRRKRED